MFVTALFSPETRARLTGAANRRAFSERIDNEWRRASRARLPISPILGDVDHFRDVQRPLRPPGRHRLITALNSGDAMSFSFTLAWYPTAGTKKITYLISEIILLITRLARLSIPNLANAKSLPPHDPALKRHYIDSMFYLLCKRIAVSYI